MFEEKGAGFLKGGHVWILSKSHTTFAAPATVILRSRALARRLEG
jgi:hypothetical protein